MIALGAIGTTGLLLAGLSLVIPLPITSPEKLELSRYGLAGGIVLSSGIGMWIYQRRQWLRQVTYLPLVLWLGLVLLVLILLASTSIHIPAFFRIGIAGGVIVTWLLFIALESKLSYSFIFGTALFCVTAWSFESLLHAIPGEHLAKEVRSTPPLVKDDQVNIVYRKNWFRGKKPCTDCPEDMLRMVTIGGSSTYGVPMHYSRLTYAERLQRMLDVRLPEKRVEVLNAGVAAFGIMQVIAALKEEILQYKPNIVSICSWFNDSAASNRWYQMPGISDKEAYERHRALRRLGSNPVYARIRDSRLFAISRWGLLKLKDSSRAQASTTPRSARPRMTPEEFRWGLEEIVRLSEEHNFLPVLTLEALHRSRPLKTVEKRNKYIEVIREVGAKHDLPVVNTIDRLHQIQDQQLFHDFIHPNAYGHAVIAEAIYEDIFSNPVTKKTQSFLKQSGISIGQAEVRDTYSLQVAQSDVDEEGILVRARAPFSGDQDTRLLLKIGSGATRDIGSLDAAWSSFTIPASSVREEPPIIDLEFRAFVKRQGQAEWEIGKTGIFMPGFLELTSGGKGNGWRVEARYNGIRVDTNGRGYNVVVIDSGSGELLASRHFDVFGNKKNFQELLSFIQSISQENTSAHKPIIAISIKTDGQHNADASALTSLFRSLGGSGRTPKGYESFILVGIPGAAPGTAIERHGYKLLTHRVGKESQAFSTRLAISLEH